MKMTTSQQVHYDSGPNMTPLVDVVMVILIFLMLTGTFGAVAKYLPSAAMPGGTAKPAPLPGATLEVFLNSPTSDTFRARIGGVTETYADARSLKDALELKRQAHASAGSAADKVQVMISPRAGTPYQHVLAAYEAAMDAQWPRIAFRPAKD